MGITDALIGVFPTRLVSRHGTIAPSVNHLTDLFLLSRQAAGRAAGTVQWYEPRLRRFAAFVEDPAIDELHADDVRRFLVAVKQGRSGAVSDSYVESHRRALATMFAFAVGEEILERSPMATVAKYRVEQKEIVPMTPDEIERLMATQNPRARLGIRNRAIMAILYDTGIRVGELVRIALADVDFERATVMIHGKAKRAEPVPLGLALRRELMAYVYRARPPRLFDDTNVLFVSRDGGSLLPTAINQMLERAGKRAGVHDAVNPHRWRHSFSTQYLINGGDPMTLQRILRHRTSTMTNRYVHLTSSHVAERHALASPLDHMGKGA